MKHIKRSPNGRYAYSGPSTAKKLALLVLTASIITGFVLQPPVASQASALPSPTVATDSQDPIALPCIQLEAKNGGYIGSWFCASEELLNKETIRMNTELNKLKGKIFKASVSMYSRLDSCHNPRGKECLTAAGHDTKAGSTIACPRRLKLGTKVRINGHEYTCDDRTAEWVEAKFGPTFDIFTENQGEAKQFGRKNLEINIIT